MLSTASPCAAPSLQFEGARWARCKVRPVASGTSFEYIGTTIVSSKFKVAHAPARLHSHFRQTSCSLFDRFFNQSTSAAAIPTSQYGPCRPYSDVSLRAISSAMFEPVPHFFDSDVIRTSDSILKTTLGSFQGTYRKVQEPCIYCKSRCIALWGSRRLRRAGRPPQICNIIKMR